MRHKMFGTLILALLGWVTVTATATATLPFVSPIFSDNMVLQRGKPNAIWGWSKPGQAIRVEIAGHVAKTVTGADGRWQVRIQPPAPGGPYTIKIDGPQHVELRGVLVGDVWLCSGQSNMQLGLARTQNGADEIKSANDPEMRLCMVREHPAYSPSAVLAGKDRKWYWADARIQGDAIVVSSPTVPAPEAARYAWQSFPTATLCNGAGLPAVPFRTDHWPGTAGGPAPGLSPKKAPLREIKHGK